MYPETAYVLNDTRRFLESAALALESKGQVFFAQQAREKAKSLSVLLSGNVACCPYRAAAEQINAAVEAGKQLQAALPQFVAMEAVTEQAAPDPFPQFAQASPDEAAQFGPQYDEPATY